MALLKCKECGKEISDTAKTCPHCGAKLSKGVGCLGIALTIIGILFCLSLLLIVIGQINQNNNRSAKLVESESNISALSAIKANKSNIQFEVLRQWDIPNNGFGMEILVDEKANKAEVVHLAEAIRSQYLSKYLLTVSIFDAREAWVNRLNESYPEEKYFKHYLVELIRNQNSGYDEIQWTAKNRDH